MYLDHYQHSALTYKLLDAVSQLDKLSSGNSTGHRAASDNLWYRKDSTIPPLQCGKFAF